MSSTPERTLAQAYHAVYDHVCGRHPRQRPWHFQWLAAKDLHRELRRLLPALSGRVLDVGCGQQPYRAWMEKAREYVGLDIESADARADIVVSPGTPWPLSDRSVDAILCTQVLEHVVDATQVMDEMARVLKPDGLLILSVPFAYNQHGWPHDYRRFSVPGTELLLSPHFTAVEIRGIGGVGSTAGVLFLNWVELASGRTVLLRALKGVSLPLWIALSAAVNLVGWTLDKLDRTGAFYGNVVAVARRRKT